LLIFTATAPTQVYTLSLHDALPISSCLVNPRACRETELVLMPTKRPHTVAVVGAGPAGLSTALAHAERGLKVTLFEKGDQLGGQDRKSTRLNSSHSQISYAVFCLKK